MEMYLKFGLYYMYVFYLIVLDMVYGLVFYVEDVFSWVFFYSLDMFDGNDWKCSSVFYYGLGYKCLEISLGFKVFCCVLFCKCINKN